MQTAVIILLALVALVAISIAVLVAVRSRAAAKAMKALVGARGTAVGWPFITLARDHEMDGIARGCLETGQKQTGVVQLAGSKQYFEVTAVPLSDGALV